MGSCGSNAILSLVADRPAGQRRGNASRSASERRADDGLGELKVSCRSLRCRRRCVADCHQQAHVGHSSCGSRGRWRLRRRNFRRSRSLCSNCSCRHARPARAASEDHLHRAAAVRCCAVLAFLFLQSASFRSATSRRCTPRDAERAARELRRRPASRALQRGLGLHAAQHAWRSLCSASFSYCPLSHRWSPPSQLPQLPARSTVATFAAGTIAAATVAASH